MPRREGVMERRGGAGVLRRVAADLGQRREATVAVERAILDALRHDGSGGLHEAPREGAVRAPADEARGRGEGEIQIGAAGGCRVDGSREVINAHAPVIYTARPSLPPEGQAGLYQTPEAEIAMAQLQLDPQRVPVMGLGPMQWLVDRCGGGMWDYAKPALVQPIAALLAATGMPVMAATLTARACVFEEAADALRSLDGATAVVFEDNAGGVRAAKQAAVLLAQRDVRVNVIGYGIAKDEAKRAALGAVCDALFEDVNAALRAI